MILAWLSRFNLLLVTCFYCIFRHLKLELLTQFPASNDEKYLVAAIFSHRDYHLTLAQCWFDAGSVSQTVAQHQTIIGPTPGVWTGNVFNPLSPYDALKHHFTSLESDLIFLQLGGFRMKLQWNWFTNTWQFPLIFHPLQVIFIHYKSRIATAIRGL